MPRTIRGTPGDIVDNLDVPRDGENIDAPDVNVPFTKLLNNDLSLYGLLAGALDRIRVLEQGVGGFTLSVPASLDVEPGQTYPLANAVAIGRINAYAGTVDLQALGLPAGVSAVFAPDPASGPVSNITFTVAPEAVAGPYDVTIRGVGSTGGYFAEAQMRLNVAAQTAVPGFTLGLPGTANLEQGGGATTATLTVDVQRQGQYSDPVTFTVQGLPAGVTAAWSTNPVTGSSPVQNAATVLTLTATGTTTPPGDYSITVRASGGSVVRTQAVRLHVAAPVATVTPDFTLGIAYDAGNSQLVNGATITVNRLNGFTGPVLLAMDLPAPGTVQPTFILNGQAGSLLATGNTVRITADGTLVGYGNAGVAPNDVLAPFFNRVAGLTATATAGGATVTRALTVQYRIGRKTS